jgi:hypothetical protein
MKELIDKFLNNGLADFEGLEINGSVPVKQEIINEAIASFLQSETGEPTPSSSGGKTKTESSDSKSSSSRVPVKALLGMVKRAEVQVVEGKVIFHFTIKR